MIEFTPETVMRLSKKASEKTKNAALDWINTQYKTRGVVADTFAQTGQPRVMVRVERNPQTHVMKPGQDGIMDFLPYLEPVPFRLAFNGRTKDIESKLVQVFVPVGGLVYRTPQTEYAIWVADHPIIEQMIGKYMVLSRTPNPATELQPSWGYWSSHDNRLNDAIVTIFRHATGT